MAPVSTDDNPQISDWLSYNPRMAHDMGDMRTGPDQASPDGLAFIGVAAG